MGILINNYPSKDSAFMQIREGIINFYKSDFSDFFKKNSAIIDQSIASLQKAYSQNSFPGMKVSYEVYPDHIGHLESEGCFRCHNDSFRSDNGRKITRNCNLCHTIIGQGKRDLMQFTNIRDTLEFQHPVDIGTAWKEANCSECHMSLY
jgi:hypothetical protein